MPTGVFANLPAMGLNSPVNPLNLLKRQIEELSDAMYDCQGAGIRTQTRCRRVDQRSKGCRPPDERNRVTHSLDIRDQFFTGQR